MFVLCLPTQTLQAGLVDRIFYKKNNVNKKYTFLEKKWIKSLETSRSSRRGK